MAARIAEAGADAAGVYFTPQLLDPSCLARCRHALVEVKKSKDGKSLPLLTHDGDVAARRWVLLDIDSHRPSHTSATDAKKASAWSVASEVRAWLTTRNWPDPIVVDSGNGYHLYYPVDPTALLVDDDSETHRGTDPVTQLLLRLAAKFDRAEAAHIDTSVYNPSRIMRVPGTFARKGPGSGDRPHRMCQLVEAPSLVPMPSAAFFAALHALPESASERTAPISNDATSPNSSGITQVFAGGTSQSLFGRKSMPCGT